MKLNITKNYFYLADYYSYTLITSADGTVTTKQYVIVPAQVSLSLSVNLFGELIIDSLYKLQIDGYLKNILDRNGEEIYINGTWRIGQTAPILNALGYKEGYRYRAYLVDGQI